MTKTLFDEKQIKYLKNKRLIIEIVFQKPRFIGNTYLGNMLLEADEVKKINMLQVKKE